MKHILPFLKKLKANNSREWFHANRESYELARAEFVGFVELLIAELQKNDKQLNGLEPKDCMFRINRDTRFTTDKTPYKKNFSASIRQGGKKSNLPGYYVHIEPGDCFLASGIYQPDSITLSNIRQEIDYNLDEFQSILENKKLKSKYGGLMNEGMTTLPPRGYKKDNPAIEFLRHKHFILIHAFNEAEFIKPNFMLNCSKMLLLTKDFNDFLSRVF
jgi:uncharacterized protein (TIGR02453 family)